MSNESIPEEAKHKVQPNVIPLHCTNKVSEHFASSLNTLIRSVNSETVANRQHVSFALLWITRRKKRTQVSSVKWSTTESEKAFPFSITPTTGSACTCITCSPWWPSSSSTSPWTRRFAWSAKCSGKTFITATRIATRDVSMLKSVSWPNPHDLWTEYLRSLPI